MKLLIWTGKLLVIPLAALLGNWVGGLLRFILTGDEVQSIQFRYTTPKGRQLANSPVATKFYPALLFAFLGKPRWFYAFIGGILAAGFVPDRMEHFWLERVIEPIFIDRIADMG